MRASLALHAGLLLVALLEGAEAQAAWQIAGAVSLAVVFIGLPWAYNRAIEARDVRQTSSTVKDSIQQNVYEKRLENRVAIADGTYVPHEERFPPASKRGSG